MFDMKKFLVVIKDFATRDTQYYTKKMSSDDDYWDSENWQDIRREVVLDVYKASSEEQAIEICADNHNIVVSNLKAYELKY